MKINKQVVFKSIIAYLVVFIISVFIMKYYAGGGRGRLEGHYQMSWSNLFSVIHYLMLADLLICYPFFYICYRDYKKYKKKLEEESQSNNADTDSPAPASL